VASTEQTEASAGTARAQWEDGTWHVGNAEIELGISGSPGDRLVLSRLAARDTSGWSIAPGSPPFALVLDGVDVTSGMVGESSRTWADDRSVRLEVGLPTEGGHHVFLQLECHDGQAIVRQWLELEPSTAVTVSRIEPARLCLSPREIQTLHTISGVQRQGGWRPEEGSYNSFQLQSSSLDAPVRRHSGLRSTWDETPWAALVGPQPGGILAALEYGGQWEMRAGRDPASGAVTLGFAPDGIQPRAQAGERWVSPAGWIGVFPGDLDSAATVMHRYVHDTVVPPTGPDFPWVQYNTWFSWFCELDEQTLLAEADRAADLGVEVFYVDAGWWVGNPVRRDRVLFRLGYLGENRDKIPSGLRAFADANR